MNSFDPEWLSFEEANPIIVPNTLDDLHPMTAKISVAGGGDQPRPVSGLERSWKLNAFKIAVSDESIGRALRIVDALAKACETRGFKWVNTPHESTGLSVVVDGERIALSLSERMARLPYRPTKQEVARQRRGENVYLPKYEYHPSGELSLFVPHGISMGTQKKWTDRPRRSLEAQLNRMMLGLRLIAAESKEHRRSLAAYGRRIDAFHQQREDLYEQIEEEREAVERLEVDADAWRRANVIRDYVAIVEAQATTPVKRQEIAAWAEWALRQADRLDPLTPSPPSILDTPPEKYEPWDIMAGPPPDEWLPSDEMANGILGEG